MDELRNLVIIVPALGAIIISFVWFLLNLLYNELKDEFNPIIRGHSKVESITIVFLVIFYSVLIIFLSLLIIIRPQLNKTEQINNSGNLSVMFFWFLSLCIISFLVIRAARTFRKHITNISSSERKKAKNKLKIMAIVTSLFCALCMVLSYACIGLIFGRNVTIAFNSNKIYTKISMDAFKNGYKNNLVIKVNGEEFKVYDEQDKKGTLNTIKISDVNKELYVNKTFKVTEGDLIQIKEGDKLIVKDKYKGYKRWNSIIEIIVIVVVPVLPITIVLGMYLTIKKFCSIKKYVIRCSNTDYVGQIWFDYDNFYLVRIKDEFRYIAKSQINTLYVIKDINNKDKMQITEVEGLIINEIYNVEQIKQWKFYLNTRKIFKKTNHSIKIYFKKLLVSIRNFYNSLLLIFKAAIIICVILAFT